MDMFGLFAAHDARVHLAIGMDEGADARVEIVDADRRLDQRAVTRDRMLECVGDQIVALLEIIAQALEVEADFRRDHRQRRVLEAMAIEQRRRRVQDFGLFPIEA